MIINREGAQFKSAPSHPKGDWTTVPREAPSVDFACRVFEVRTEVCNALDLFSKEHVWHVGYARFAVWPLTEAEDL